MNATLHFDCAIEIDLDEFGFTTEEEALTYVKENAYDLLEGNREMLYETACFTDEVEIDCDETELKLNKLINLVEENGGSVHFTIPDNCPGDGWDGCAHEDGCYMFGNNHFEGEFYEYEDKADELVNWLDEIIEAVEAAIENED